MIACVNYGFTTFFLACARGMKAEDLDKKKQEWRCKTLNIFNWWYPSIVLFTTFFIVQLNFPFPSAEHILDAKREVQEEQQIGMKAIESAPDFDSWMFVSLTTETKKSVYV